MSVNLDAMGFDRWSFSDRLELIELLWDSLPEQVDPEEVPDWHLAEISRRHADAEANPGVGQPWREVLKNLRAKS